MPDRIAFFDFDGTLTTRDTLLEFIRFNMGSFRFYLGFILNSPWLIAYRLKLISNQKAKERILTWFFGKRPLASFQQQCDRFCTVLLPYLMRPKGLNEIERLQKNGFRVVIVSASPLDWIDGWARPLGIEVLATRLAVSPPPDPARLTGRIMGFNCHGKEKVRRINEAYHLAEYQEIYAYGDSSGDRPMLALATHSFYKPFR